MSIELKPEQAEAMTFVDRRTGTPSVYMNPPVEPMDWPRAARILRNAVLDIQEEMARRHDEYAKALNRRVDAENVLAMVAAGKRDLLTREECRELAIKLGVSPATQTQP